MARVVPRRQGGKKCNKERTSVYVVNFFKIQIHSISANNTEKCLPLQLAFIVSFALQPHIITSEYIYSVIYIKPSSGDLCISYTIYRHARWSSLGLQIIGRKSVYGHTASFPNFPLKYI